MCAVNVGICVAVQRDYSHKTWDTGMDICKEYQRIFNEWVTPQVILDLSKFHPLAVQFYLRIFPPKIYYRPVGDIAKQVLHLVDALNFPWSILG